MISRGNLLKLKRFIEDPNLKDFMEKIKFRQSHKVRYKIWVSGIQNGINKIPKIKGLSVRI